MKYKLEINFKICVFPIFRFGNWWTRHKGLKEKNDLIYPTKESDFELNYFLKENNNNDKKIPTGLRETEEIIISHDKS